jgi:hypothetical protein
MSMGQDILTSFGVGEMKSSSSQLPPELSQLISESEDLDSILNIWQNSDSFVLALEHADIGTKLMRELVHRNKKIDLASRDTPFFFGFCCCQIVTMDNVGPNQLNCGKAICIA